MKISSVDLYYKLVIRLVDASIAYDLKEIARQFENNDFIYKMR